jgi:hypothetical protein
MRADDFPDGVIVDPGVGDPMMGMSTGMEGAFGLVLILVVAGVIFSIVVGARKYRILRDAGTDPFTVDAAVAAKVLKSDMLAPPAASAPARSVEERLGELDDLFARGVISADEHREARAALLRG